MTSQTQSKRMLDLDLDLIEFLILQPEQNLDLGLVFKSAQHVGLQTERRQVTK